MDKKNSKIVKESVDLVESKPITFVLNPSLDHPEACYKHFPQIILTNNIKLDVEICYRSKIDVLPTKTWVSLTMGVVKVTTTNSRIYELDWNTISFTKTVHFSYKRSDFEVINRTDFVSTISEQLGIFQEEVEQEIADFIQFFNPK